MVSVSEPLRVSVGALFPRLRGPAAPHYVTVCRGPAELKRSKRIQQSGGKKCQQLTCTPVFCCDDCGGELFCRTHCPNAGDSFTLLLLLLLFKERLLFITVCIPPPPLLLLHLFPLPQILILQRAVWSPNTATLCLYGGREAPCEISGVARRNVLPT